jgi:hypothetical protein
MKTSSKIIAGVVALALVVGLVISLASLGQQFSAGRASVTTAASANGKTGATGENGAAGQDGAAGPAGVNGANGAAGAKGAQGSTGSTGATGGTGQTGAAGQMGAAGQTGASGLTGAAGSAGLTGATGPAGPVGPVGPIGPTGPIGISGEAAEFYALMPGDNADALAVGDDVQFPQDGPSTTSGISRVDWSSFALAAAGVYKVSFQVPVDEPGQLVLTINGAELPYTVVGRATGTSQITLVALVQTTSPQAVLTVRNLSSPSPLTITPLAGGTMPVSATLLIELVKAS